MLERPDITVLTVNYNAGAMLRDCIRSLQADEALAAASRIVVDNASTDDSWRTVADLPGVRIVRLESNKGFGAANNEGLRYCETPFVLMANPDTLIHSGGIAQLIAFMEENPEVGLIGPRLLTADESTQVSIGNYPTLLREAVECVFLHRILPPSADGLVQMVTSQDAYAQPHAVDWVCGAAMLARTEALREIGGFDEAFFLYAEEIDLCRRLSSAGWQVWYHPGACVKHIGGDFDADPFLALENQRSRLKYFRKHHGRLQMVAFACIIALRLTLRVPLLFAAYVRSHEERWLRRGQAALAVLRRYPRLAVGLARERVAGGSAEE